MLNVMEELDTIYARVHASWIAYIWPSYVKEMKIKREECVARLRYLRRNNLEEKLNDPDLLFEENELRAVYGLGVVHLIGLNEVSLPDSFQKVLDDNRWELYD